MSLGNLFRAATAVPLLLYLQSCNNGLTILPQPLSPEPGSAALKNLSLGLDENSVILDYNYSPDADTAKLWLEGSDALHFVIDAHSGALNPVTALDFEAPQDSNLDNHYEFLIARKSRADGLITYPLKIDVRITDLPLFGSVDLSIDPVTRTLSLAWSIEDNDPRFESLSLGVDNTATSIYTQVDLDQNGIIDGGDLLPSSLSSVSLLPALVQHPLQLRSYRLYARDIAGQVLTQSPIISGHNLDEDALIQYIKSPQIDDIDWFGYDLSLSSDGRVLAVGAPKEDGSGPSINPPYDNAAGDAGAVYIYHYSESGWVFSDYLKSNNPDGNDKFGTSVDLSTDGNTLVVGAPGESGSGTGVNPTDNNLSPASGAAYVYQFEAGEWQQPTYLKAHNPDWFNSFGYDVALNATGDVLAVGADEEDRDGTGIDSSSAGSSVNSGAVYVFRHDGVNWAQESYIKTSNSETLDSFGSAVALNALGNMLVATSPSEDGDGIEANPTENNSATDSGAAYVFRHDGSGWYESDYIKADNTQAGDYFGSALALDSSGNTLVIAAIGEDGSGAGVQSLSDELATDAGAAFVFNYDGIQWHAPIYLKARAPTAGDEFGGAVAMTADGLSIAVGARRESGLGIGLGAVEDESAGSSGAAYVFRNISGNWQPPTYIKAGNTAVNERFGISIDIGDSAATVVVGANFENGAGSGVNPATDKSAHRVGAIYVY